MNSLLNSFNFQSQCFFSLNYYEISFNPKNGK